MTRVAALQIDVRSPAYHAIAKPYDVGAGQPLRLTAQEPQQPGVDVHLPEPRRVPDVGGHRRDNGRRRGGRGRCRPANAIHGQRGLLARRRPDRLADAGSRHRQLHLVPARPAPQSYRPLHRHSYLPHVIEAARHEMAPGCWRWRRVRLRPDRRQPEVSGPSMSWPGRIRRCWPRKHQRSS